MKQFVITGAGGFLGGVTLDRLLSRSDVRVKAVLLPGERLFTSDDRLEVVYGDITDRSFCERVIGRGDTVCHLAGIVDIAPDSDIMRKVNVQGTKNIVDACIISGAARLVYVSSVHVITPKRGNEPMAEPEVIEPESLVGMYARTKAEATNYVLLKAGEGLLDAVVVYPSGIIGPYDRKVSNMGQVITDYISGKLRVCVKGGYNFVDVRDVADGIISAAERGESGQGYILSGETISIRQLMEYMNQTLGRKKVPPTLATWFLKLVAPIAEGIYKMLGKKPIFSRYSLYTLMTNCNFVADKAVSRLGFSPRPAAETIADTVEWFLQNDSDLKRRACRRGKKALDVNKG